MSQWGDTQHPSHQPGEPDDAGFSTGLVHCTACRTLLRSDRGMAANPKVYATCVPLTSPSPVLAGSGNATLPHTISA